ncbi:OmpA family protein [Verrucomicrobiales bacterium BCK34]|nr:OmpA family protein [Verrucomicrobiales bacterium BCK34]
MRAFNIQQLTLLLFFLSGSAVGSPVHAEASLEVRFLERKVSFSGAMDSEETGQRLANAVRSVRPDLAIVNAGLTISPDIEMPDVGDLESALTELGISTHLGRIEIRPDSILVGGITDSVVTITALRIRLNSLLEGRRFINRICIVPSADLPEIKVSLSSNSGEAELLDFEYHPSAEEVFEAPGLPLKKWFPTLVMLSDFDRLEGKKKAPLVAQPIIAMPVGGNDAAMDADRIFEALEAQDSTPQPTFQTVGSIRFSRNAFLLQANQEPAIAEVTKALTSPELKGLDVILKPVKASGGSGAYNDYICEKRADEVKRILSETGLSLANLSTELIASSSPIDDGEVQIVVKIPPPPPPPEEVTEEPSDGVKVMVGTTANPGQEVSESTVENDTAGDKLPEHPLKRFRLNTAPASE